METKFFDHRDSRDLERPQEPEQPTLPTEALDDDEGYVVEDAPVTISEY